MNTTPRCIQISTAESCTSGSLASRITDIKGSSNFFKGGVVSYSEESKRTILNIKTEDIYSAECAKEMAQNVCTLLNADIGIAITGYIEKPYTAWACIFQQITYTTYYTSTFPINLQECYSGNIDDLDRNERKQLYVSKIIEKLNDPYFLDYNHPLTIHYQNKT